MKILKLYETFNTSDSEKEEQQFELLEGFIHDKENIEFIDRFLRGRGMTLHLMEILECDAFNIKYDLQGEYVPQRISYYIDDLNEMLSEKMGVGLTWNFGPGFGHEGVGTLKFMLEDDLDPKFLKAGEIIKYS